MSSWEGWTISLFITEDFLFGRALEMILSQGSLENLDRETSTELYRSRLRETLQNECFRGARVEVLVLPGERDLQHSISGPGAVTRERREEAASKLYREAYQLWRSQDWLVWKGPDRPPSGASTQN